MLQDALWFYAHSSDAAFAQDLIYGKDYFKKWVWVLCAYGQGAGGRSKSGWYPKPRARAPGVAISLLADVANNSKDGSSICLVLG